MYYVIQENLFREYGFRALSEHLNRNKLDYEIVAYRPFTNELNVKTDRKDVFLFGSINAGKVAQHYNWNPGTIYNANFDMDICLKKYSDFMLNSDGIVQDVDMINGWDKDSNVEYFMRPTHDTKTFESNIYSWIQWKEYMDEIEQNGTKNIVQAETKLFYARPKQGIQQEIRCWIVDGKVVTISQYRIGRRFNALNMDNNEEAYIFCKDMIKLFQPAKAFVMDICLYQDEYRIVELGCINHCGFYDANMSKLIQSLESSFQ